MGTPPSEGRKPQRYPGPHFTRLSAAHLTPVGSRAEQPPIKSFFYPPLSTGHALADLDPALIATSFLILGLAVLAWEHCGEASQPESVRAIARGDRPVTL